MNIPPDLADRILAFIADPLIPIALIAGISVVLMRLVSRTVRRVITTLFDRQSQLGLTGDLPEAEIVKRIDTLDSLATKSIHVFILAIALVMIMGELNFDIGPAVAGLGIVGIAVGFGAQSLVRDFFNGALILIENQFGVGDVISAGGVSGVVEDFSLRRTTLRDLSGVVHTVPNGEITVTSNMTRSWARVNEDVQVAYATDMARAFDVVTEVGQAIHDDPEWSERVLEPLSVLRINSLDDSGVTLKVTGKVRASDQWAVAGELRRRLLLAFADAGIEIPFPHRVVISGTSDGPVAPTSTDPTGG